MIYLSASRPTWPNHAFTNLVLADTSIPPSSRLPNGLEPGNLGKSAKSPGLVGQSVHHAPALGGLLRQLDSSLVIQDEVRFWTRRVVSCSDSLSLSRAGQAGN
jgi:hypothetical protein